MARGKNNTNGDEPGWVKDMRNDQIELKHAIDSGATAITTGERGNNIESIFNTYGIQVLNKSVSKGIQVV